MNHFLKKNFSNIFGAGGGSKGDPPAPATLQPPKLGVLQALTSYAYSESVELLGEGPIEGIVNQNGQYVEGHRVFEGVYIDDTPVKKTANPLDPSIVRKTVSLSPIMELVTDSWFAGENFLTKSISSLPTEIISYEPARTVNDPYVANKFSLGGISAEIILGKTNIAKSISRGINSLKRVSLDETLSASTIELAKQKLLRYEAFSTFSIIEREFLRDYPMSLEYPFFCVKINLGDLYNSLEPSQPIQSFAINRYCSSYLEDDIHNLIFQKLEISEIGKTRILRNLSWMDMSYLYINDGDVDDVRLAGHIYLFGIQSAGFPTQESISALRNNVKNLHIIDFSNEKYNYSNILVEARNGDELQTALGFFNRTYLDKQYGIKLLGPFTREGEIPRVKNFGLNVPRDGILDIYPSRFEYIGTDEAVTLSDADKTNLATLWGLEDYLLKTGSKFPETRAYLLSSIRSAAQIYNTDGNYSVKVLFPRTKTTGGFKSGIVDQYYTFTLTKTDGIFSRSLGRTVVSSGGSAPVNLNGTIDNFKKEISACILAIGDFEGSTDTRNGKSYSDWSNGSLSQFDEEPNSVVHTVRNPNVSSVYLTMGIRALSDTAEVAKTLPGTVEVVDAGTRIPSVVKFRIEIGLQDSNGAELPPTRLIDYQVVGLAESPALIDIGRTENANNIPSYARFIQGSESSAASLTLPEPVEGSFRYVKVTRTTPETYSVLIRREISLEKITEIIDSKFSYPNSAIVGVKLDSRTLSSIPARSYDVRMKRIMVPSNYFPLFADGSDKRYFKTQEDFDVTPTSSKLIYDGDWDGTFKEAWSDNPAWILFDLLTNTRYGMGNYITADQINIWELYRIGRFCDGVDDNGYFTGVQNDGGGVEPRYTCNIILADKVNVFDAVKNLVSTFRGNIFYYNSYIDFTDDRVKLPYMFFNNQNVKDGVFNYTNSRRDQQFNTIEVSYFDRNDGFKAKTEYVEDPEDIKRRGVLRTEIDTFGVTSRSQAARIGKHVVFSTINENQAVSFRCGPEILACRPGNLISVEDDLKSLQKNIGRVLDIDYANKVLTLDEKFNTGNYLSEITLFVPTGQKTYDDYYDLSISPSKLALNKLYSNDVPQVATFQATGYDNSLNYGSKLFLNQTGENILLLNKARIGGVYSITLSGLKQEIYKLTTITENSPLEYDVAGIKFDTGKFGQIEDSQSLNDFYNNYPNVTSPTQGAETIAQNNVYQLSYPVIYQFTTGNYDQQNDAVDISGAWSGVNGATHYDYELVTPRFSSITGRTTGLNVTFTDQSQAGRFSLRVSARNESSVPNPIGPTYSSGITILSYSAPVRPNSIFAGIQVKNFA